MTKREQAERLAQALGLPMDDGQDEVAWDRPEWESCERGTPGCSVRHSSTSTSPCQTW